MSRRLFVGATLSMLASAAAGQAPAPGTRPWYPRTYDNGLIPAFSFELISLEAGGDLGVAVLDTESGRASGWDEEGRYPLNSTFKFLLTGIVLQRVDRGQEQLDRPVAVQPADIVAWSPVVEAAVGGTMTVRMLCEAAMKRSDNAAANLLLRSLDGPQGLTARLRDLGDQVTRVDRYETGMNDVPPGDPRDSSSPLQMLTMMERLLLGDVLSAQGKAQLFDWMRRNRTGDDRIRAGVPAGWTVGDRTGSGPRGETATIAAIHPPGRKPLLMTVYIKNTPRPREMQADFHAELARIATNNVLLPPYEPYPDE
jgi:beta-lactamase class A